jgi:hypothetical protein
MRLVGVPILQQAVRHIHRLVETPLNEFQASFETTGSPCLVSVLDFAGDKYDYANKNGKKKCNSQCCF